MEIMRDNPIRPSMVKGPDQRLDNAVVDICEELSMMEGRTTARMRGMEERLSESLKSEELGNAFDVLDDDVNRMSEGLAARCVDIHKTAEMARGEISVLSAKVNRSLSPMTALILAITVLNLILCGIIVSTVAQ